MCTDEKMGKKRNFIEWKNQVSCNIACKKEIYESKVEN
jgi:hypothetical protein